MVGDPDFDVGFLKQEWALVVQANGIIAMPAYLQVPRTGRGRTLTKPQRGKVWKVFEEYRSALKDKGKQEWLQVIQETRRYLEKKKEILPYRAVVVDESQDFHPEEWKLIRSLVPSGANDLFLVGDAHQRIYGRKVTLKDCGVLIQGRSTNLKINYRTTEQIRNWSMALIQGIDVDDLDGEKDREKGYKSLLSGDGPGGAEVRHRRGGGSSSWSRRSRNCSSTSKPEEICLVARTKKLLEERYQPLLKAAKVPCVVLEKKNDPGEPGVRLGDHAPGQGAGVPRDAPGRGQQRRRAHAGVLGGRRPHRQGRTRGAGAVPAVRGGDQGQGSPDRHGPRQPQPFLGEAVHTGLDSH